MVSNLQNLMKCEVSTLTFLLLLLELPVELANVD